MCDIKYCGQFYITNCIHNYVNRQQKVKIKRLCGVVGGGQHQNVSNAAKQWVNLAQAFLEIATKTEATPLPATNEVKFYLLTNNGIYVGRDVMQNFENNSSAWLKLFEEGNM